MNGLHIEVRYGEREVLPNETRLGGARVALADFLRAMSPGTEAKVSYEVEREPSGEVVVTFTGGTQPTPA